MTNYSEVSTHFLSKFQVNLNLRNQFYPKLSHMPKGSFQITLIAPLLQKSTNIFHRGAVYLLRGQTTLTLFLQKKSALFQRAY